MVTRRRILVAIALGIIIIILLVIFLHKSPSGSSSNSPGSTATTQESTSQPNTTVKPRAAPSNDALSEAIAGDDNPGSTYKIISSDLVVASWYIVRVIMTNQFGTFNQIAVVHQGQDTGALNVVAGPDTSFPHTYLQSQGIPDEVINKLPTYDDQQ